MLTIDNISYTLPNRSLKIMDDYATIGINQNQAKVYSRLYGLEYVPFQEDGNLKSLIEKAVSNVIKKVAKNEITHIIYAHTGAIISPFSENLIREIKYQLDLNHAIAFGTSFNKCTSLFTSLRLAENLLKNESNNAKILLITADLAFNRDLRVIDGTTLVGDAAGATIVSSQGTDNQLIAIKQIIDGRFSHGVWLNKEEIKELEKITPETLGHTVRQLLVDAHLTIEQIQCILPHNVSVALWIKSAKRLGIDPEKVYLKMIPQTAHCFCSDMLINYANAKNEGYFKKGDYVLSVAIGMGTSFAAALIKC